MSESAISNLVHSFGLSVDPLQNHINDNNRSRHGSLPDLAFPFCNG